jgi:hypothetical protein
MIKIDWCTSEDIPADLFTKNKWTTVQEICYCFVVKMITDDTEVEVSVAVHVNYLQQTANNYTLGEFR